MDRLLVIVDDLEEYRKVLDAQWEEAMRKADQKAERTAKKAAKKEAR